MLFCNLKPDESLQKASKHTHMVFPADVILRLHWDTEKWWWWGRETTDRSKSVDVDVDLEIYLLYLYPNAEKITNCTICAYHRSAPKHACYSHRRADLILKLY